MADVALSPEKSPEPPICNKILFYDYRLMPCCYKRRRFLAGPRGGLCTNIKCFHCGQKWNVCFESRFIEKI